MTPTNIPEAARLAEELLPCPFCGDPHPKFTDMGAMDRTFILCPNCGADVDSLNCDGDIREVWNRRAAKQDAAPTSAGTVPAGSESSGLLKLARYGAAMLHWHRGDNPSECGDVDAITCEEEAMRCGVLEGRNVDEPCCADCICAPFIGWEVCYFMPDDVRAARDKLSAARNPGACSVTDGEAKK